MLQPRISSRTHAAKQAKRLTHRSRLKRRRRSLYRIRNKKFLLLHRPIRVLTRNTLKSRHCYQRIGRYLSKYANKYSNRSRSRQYVKGDVYSDFMLSRQHGVRDSYPFHIYLPYYVYKSAIPSLAVLQNIKKWNVLSKCISSVAKHNNKKSNKALKKANKKAYLKDRSIAIRNCSYIMQMLYDVTEASWNTSCHSSIMCTRHVLFSIMRVGVNTYSGVTYANEQQALLLQKYRTSISQRILPAFKHGFYLISFLFKLYYLNAISVVNSAAFFTNAFFQTIISISGRSNNEAFLVLLLSRRNLCVSFHNFLHGVKSSRILFLLSRIATTSSFYLTCWLLSKYGILAIRVYLYTLRFELFFCIHVLFLHSKIYKNRATKRYIKWYKQKYMTLNAYIYKISTIHAHCNTFSKMLAYFKSCSLHIHSFIVRNISFSTHILKLNSIFLIYIIELGLFSIFDVLRKKALRNLTSQIEHTLYAHNNVKHLFIARFYYRSVPPITNAKMLCDYILIQLSNGLKIKEVFARVFRWQKYWQTVHDNNSVRFLNIFGANLGNFLYPLKGIRLICSGPPYKARRTTSSKYLLWVSDEFITGRMPLSTMNLQIDYYQSVAVIRRSNIGIKVWLLFEDVL